MNLHALDRVAKRCYSSLLILPPLMKKFKYNTMGSNSNEFNPPLVDSNLCLYGFSSYSINLSLTIKNFKIYGSF